MKLLVSFSGGKTSAYMAILIKQRFKNCDIRYIFANTGQEHSKTYEFIHKVQDYFEIPITWVEAVVDPRKGKGTRHKIVTRETYSSTGKPFEEVISKYGLPNKGYLHCTREMKIHPIADYGKKVFGKEYFTAIGIRSDEIDRIPTDYLEKRYVYPLADLGITKQMVNDFWEKQPFTLDIPERLGNCTWCFKKSFKKHKENIAECPGIYDFPREMELKYSKIITSGERKIFRGERTVNELFQAVNEEMTQEEMNQSNSCDESCEVF